MLLGDPDERCSPAEFLEFGSSHVGAGGAQPPQDVQDGELHVPAVRHLHGPALRSPAEEEIGYCSYGQM